jgi:hypothetical protein
MVRSEILTASTMKTAVFSNLLWNVGQYLPVHADTSQKTAILWFSEGLWQWVIQNNTMREILGIVDISLHDALEVGSVPFSGDLSP